MDIEQIKAALHSQLTELQIWQSNYGNALESAGIEEFGYGDLLRAMQGIDSFAQAVADLKDERDRLLVATVTLWRRLPSL